ncbi:MAG: tetratricopeptide repeat protein [Pleurocapsa sp. MO_226.B13]|nr:tetratricopeptide repeat protein [Pleurocapsa sp. MO_226.B13]
MFIETKQQNSSLVIENLHGKAVARHKENKLEDALDLYLESIGVNEIQPEWIYANAITLATQIAHLDIGISLKQKAEKIYPESDEISRAIALLFQKQNDLENALKYYQKSIDLNYEQPEWVYIKLYNLLLQSKLVQQAETIRKQGLKLYPQSKTFNQITPNSLASTTKQTETESRSISQVSSPRETPQSIEHCVDLKVSNIRRQLMDSAIVEQYQILLEQMLCSVKEGVKEMDVDALVHCLAEIKTDIHYLKTKLIEPPAVAVDPQARQEIDLNRIVSSPQPIPIKCELKDRIVGSGWHGREQHGRWTGPGTISSLVLPYPTAGRYRLEMIVRSQAKPGLLQSLKINLGDRPLDISPISTSDTFPVVVRGEVVIPQEQNRPFLAVDLTIDETVNAQTADTRLIGLLVEKISLIPLT